MNKWYMYNHEPVIENETHKAVWEFEIGTDLLISARCLDLLIVYKKMKTDRKVDFAVLVDYMIKRK